MFFVLIIYYWNFEKNKLSCISHTCITPDLNKSNGQVTKFIDTVFQLYSTYYRDGKHGRIRSLSLWSDNCGEQFKNKYHFGWGSAFLREYKLDTIFFNYFAPGHGKGICDSEGGINKNAAASAALCGVALTYLVNHQCDKNHSQLIRFDRICAVCIGTTPNGTFVNAMKLLDQTSPAPYHVYDFKDAYLSIFQDYKKTRVAVFGNYEIMR